MAIRVALSHRTRYAYARPVGISPQTIRLRPAPHTRTPIHSYSLRIEPGKHFLNWQQDPYGSRAREDLGVRRDRRSRGGPRGVRPFQLLRRAVRGTVPLRVRGTIEARARPFLDDGARFAEAYRLSREARSNAAADGGFSRRYEPRALSRRRIRDPARAGCSDAGADAVAPARFVSRLELAARACAASAGDRGAFRIGIFDPAHA